VLRVVKFLDSFPTHPPTKTATGKQQNMMQSSVNSSGPTLHATAAKNGVVGGARRGLRDITNVTTGGNAVSGKAVVKPAAAAKGGKPSATTFFAGSEDTALSARSTEPQEESDIQSISEASAFNRREADDIDARDASNPLMVTHYVQEIYAFMREKEVNAVSATYMQRQPHINEKMRAILIDWLVRLVCSC
jgi:hypothetical protein